MQRVGTDSSEHSPCYAALETVLYRCLHMHCFNRLLSRLQHSAETSPFAEQLAWACRLKHFFYRFE